jgi:hypothetical protein
MPFRQAAGLETMVSEDLWAQMEEAVSIQELRHGVAGCFTAATAISPLLMLVPKSYASDAFQKDCLLAVVTLVFSVIFLLSLPCSAVHTLPG